MNACLFVEKSDNLIQRLMKTVHEESRKIFASDDYHSPHVLMIILFSRLLFHLQLQQDTDLLTWAEKLI